MTFCVELKGSKHDTFLIEFSETEQNFFSFLFALLLHSFIQISMKSNKIPSRSQQLVVCYQTDIARKLLNPKMILFLFISTVH